jgi:hypothetical protein
MYRLAHEILKFSPANSPKKFRGRYHPAQRKPNAALIPRSRAAISAPDCAFLKLEFLLPETLAI